MFCTEKPVTREQMESYELPVHENTVIWQGIHHKELADMLVEEAGLAGLTVKEEKWGYGSTDHRLVGALKVEPNVPLGLNLPDGLEFSLGVLHANDLSRAWVLVVGAEVGVCTNGMAVGEFAVKKRHTYGLNLREAIQGGIHRFIEEARRIGDVAEGLKNREMRTWEVNDILVESGRTGVMPWSRIGKVDREYRNPRYPEFKERTAWSLYNAFTEVAKQSPVYEQFGVIRKSLLKIQEVTSKNN